jgi:two-component system LytT family response regulator
VLVPERGAVHVVPVRDLEWVQADGYCLWLHTPARAWLLRERMHRMERRLAGAGFVRVHRSALVRADAVRALEAPVDAEPVAVLRSGARVRVARERVAELLARLGTRTA